jgi:acetyl-CoA carboxylase biotin carboxyl carrier protein
LDGCRELFGSAEESFVETLRRGRAIGNSPMVIARVPRHNGQPPRVRDAILSTCPIRRIDNPVMAKIEVKSEITGTVWQIKSKPGEKVESGDTLIVIESMKMEIPVITEDAGTVREILVAEKDPVAEGQVVAILEE